MKNKFIAVIAVAAVALAAGFFYNRYRIAPELEIKSLHLTDLDGNPVDLDSFENKKLFLNFFATWCKPCIHEISSLEVAQDILANDNFKFFLISDEPVAVLKNFKTQTGTKLLIIHSSKKLHELKIYTLPTAYLLNGNDEIIYKHVGEEKWGNESVIKKLRLAGGQ